MRATIALACLLALASCGSPPRQASNVAANSNRSNLQTAVGEGVKRGDESYEVYDDRRDSYKGSRGTFDGEGCTVNCGGHGAGYAWAEENSITDPDQCGGRSWSFIEGCQAYAREQSSLEEGGSIDKY